MLAVINVALRRRIGGVAGLANSEHLNASVHCDRGHSFAQSAKLFAKQTKFEPFYFCNEKQLLCSCFVVEWAGLANSEHIYMRACSVTEVTTCAKHKTVCKANSGSSCMFLQ